LEKSGRRPRPLTSLFGLIAIPLVVAVLVGPHIYNLVRARSWPGEIFESLAPIKFEKVTQRCAMVTALLLLVPLIRRSGLAGNIRRALTLDADGRRDLARACFVGCASMSALYIAGLAFGVYEPEDYVTSVGPSLRVFASYLVGSIFIGFFEETLFRGFVFGAARARIAFWPAAFAASLFFAAIHFVSPEYSGKIRIAKWDQGIRLLPYLFEGFHWAKHWPFFCTLFLMGLTLCVLYERRGHLAWCIGLHGGWVLAMRLGNYFLGRDREFLEWWFSRSDYIAKSPAGVLVILIFFVWSLTFPRNRPVETPHAASLP
jgi:hypothetical protein